MQCWVKQGAPKIMTERAYLTVSKMKSLGEVMGP